MTTTRLTSSNDTALSADEIYAWLRIDAGADALTINMLIAAATEVVEQQTGLVILPATYSTSFPRPQIAYYLPLSPVQAVQSVSMTAQDGTTTPLTGWTYADGVLSLAAPVGPILVTYSAGFPTVAAIPDSIRHAIAVLVAASYDGRSEISDQAMTTVMRLCAPHRRYTL